jgi:hypothetical protein
MHTISMDQTISLILWLIGLAFVSMLVLTMFTSKVSEIWFGRIFKVLFFVLVALIVSGQVLVATDRMQNSIQHPGVWALLALIVLFLFAMTTLSIWIYRTSKNWDFVLDVNNKLEWPVKDKHLMSKLSKLQIVFWKVTAFLRLLLLVSIAAVIVVKVILLIRL